MSLKAQIASLQRKLAKVELGNGSASNASCSNAANSGAGRRRKRRRTRNIRSGIAGNNPAYVAPAVMASNALSGSRRLRRNPTLNTNDGVIRVSRNEFCVEVKGGVVGALAINALSFPWLANLAKCFDRIKWLAVTAYWKPAVGTTQGGLILYGVDWDADKSATLAKEVVAALTPLSEHPVWQQGNLVLPSGRLMTRKEYKIAVASEGKEDFDTTPGYLCYSCGGKKDEVMGELWVRYSVEMFGTAKP